jgi:hypothetical protein
MNLALISSRISFLLFFILPFESDLCTSLISGHGYQILIVYIDRGGRLRTYSTEDEPHDIVAEIRPIKWENSAPCPCLDT